ncbi:proline-rich receptor-like protein kinase PERK8 [Portunus trituberculatus]|uniref:proline-rich receptor-like protein kinase PERK8 n=1 Tax=Portunus trituberculatus TaxID=210409 RepID=UPI001E1D0071|nr:proline-rich receptor-like protein kinase PERK8 [Portunus trituberculatus]
MVHSSFIMEGKRVKLPLYQISEMEYLILSEDPGGDEVGVVRVRHHPLCLEPPLPTTQCKMPPLPTFTTTRPQPSTSGFTALPSTSTFPSQPSTSGFTALPSFPHSPPPPPSQHHHPRDSGRNLPNCNKKKSNKI